MKKKDFTKKAFMKWLKTKSPQCRIKTGCENNCPIAQFLLEKGGYPMVAVGGDEAEYGWILLGSPLKPKNEVLWGPTIQVKQRWNMPKWASSFISGIDDKGHEKGTNKVSPKECLKVLEAV